METITTSLVVIGCLLLHRFAFVRFEQLKEEREEATRRHHDNGC